MHSAAVTRDVLEVVEGRACVKFHLLPVTAVSLRAIDQTYASNFDECDQLSSTGTGTHCSRLDAGDKRAPPLVDMTRRGFTSALATVSNPARTTRICAVCESSDCHCHQAGGGPGGGHENIQIYSAHQVEVPARVASSTKERVARPVVDAERR